MIVHITWRVEWATAVTAPTFRPASLDTEGFIHCSTPAQLLGPANALFRGQTGLVLLCIAPEKVRAPIVYEDCYGTGQPFPHVYGPLNRDAVVAVLDFPPRPDGSFDLPPDLAERDTDLS